MDLTEKTRSITEDFLKTNEKTRTYYHEINSRTLDLFLKTLTDKILALIILIVALPIILFLAIWIKIDSRGGVFYRQERITRYGRKFKIFKFRTMVADADKKGSLVTVGQDTRITRVGHFIRRYRLDEIPQLFNVLLGDMSFVGVRPEVPKYVEHYTDEMLATLILPAGITSPASILYKDEDVVLEKYCSNGYSVDQAYIEKVLPEKMKYNLEYIKHFGWISDMKIMIETAIKVVK